MTRDFFACKAKVFNRGRAPDAFLNELIEWALNASDDIFVPNDTFDIYSSVREDIGPWQGALHRKACMLEVLRVLGGFESSWDWNEDVDTTNPDSNTLCTAEAGIFQCSGNSMNIDPSLKALLMAQTGKVDCQTFRNETKANHPFAIEYCARLLRFTTKHHGPIKHQKIHEWLRRDAVAEFKQFLQPQP